MTNRFKVDLRGIIDLAAHHLYTSPEVFVRESIQNAVDAVTARRRLEPGYTGRVRLELTPADDERPGAICINDDGIGLTEAEVHQFLSTVGASTKRDSAEEVVDRLTGEEGGFLGRFGIGLLSCFMVSDEIVVITRSAREPHSPAVEWRGRADGSYTVRTLPDSPLPPGSSVYLTAKEDAAEYFEPEQLTDLARRYAEMLPVEILVGVGDAETAINRPTPPWKLDPSDGVALADTCQAALGFLPLDAFRVSTEAGKVEGYAFIRSGRTEPWGGTQKLYAHGMFVADRVHGLVPRWATFVGCVLNTTALRLTASREGVHNDAALDACSEQLASAIRGRLLHLMRHDRAAFNAVMAVHDTEIRGLAIKDAEFFDVIADLLEFETNMGRIRFGEFRLEHDRLLLARTTEQFRRLSAVARAAGLRVFNGGYTFHEELLCRAAERHPELEVLAFDTADIADLWPEPEDADRYRALIEAASPALQAREAELVVREFEPHSIPAFFALGLEAEFHRQLDLTKSRASGLWNEVLDAMAPRPEALSPTRLCLNARSPLVRRLADMPDPLLQRTGVEVLFVQALMAGQHALSPAEWALLHGGLETLLARCTGEG
jgi:molecular chaperone HtpG